MELRALNDFLAIAREENITRAAESLHITQPSLSKQLMDLEQELGKKLLVRGKRKVTLTENGVLLRKRADEIVALLEKTEQEIGSERKELSGEVAIGGMFTPTVLETAAALRKKHPGIQYHFYSSDATDVTERLDHGSLDFAVLLEPVDTSKYEYISLPDTSSWGVLMKPDCPLAGKEAVEREDLRTIPLVFHRRAGLQQRIALWAQTDPEHLHIAATYNVVNGSLVPFVKSGLGYFLTTKDLIEPEMGGGICFRPLKPPLEMQYAVVWKRYPVFSKAAEAFLKQLADRIL